MNVLPPHEHLAMGGRPNIVLRLQGLAGPDTVAISTVTVRLVHGAFILGDLERRSLKGVTEPMQVLRVRAPIEESRRDDEANLSCLPTLVGREEEDGLLRRH